MEKLIYELIVRMRLLDAAKSAGGEGAYSDRGPLLLELIDAAGEMRFSEIMEKFKAVSPASIFASITALREAHLIYKKTDLKDHGSVWVRLTSKGKKALARVRGKRALELCGFVQKLGLSAEEKVVLERVLEKTLAAINN